jgi:hypothetical protein
MRAKRTWSTAFERKRLRKLNSCFEELIAYYYADGWSSSSDDESSDDDDDDDDSSLSSSSSISSGSSTTTSDEEEEEDDTSDHDDSSISSVDTEDILLAAAVEVEIWNHRLRTNVRKEGVEYGRKLIIADMTEEFCVTECRFRKCDLQELSDKLWPRMQRYFPIGSLRDAILLPGRYTVHFETALLLYLYRLAKPRTIMNQMDLVFGMGVSHISVTLKIISKAFFELQKLYLRDVRIWQHRFALYAEAIHRKTHRLNDVWSFIDGTCRPICRPKRFQRRCYTRYKRCHALKFQSVVVPDGFVAHLRGPSPGARHDARVLQESGILPELQAILPNGGYRMYGDCAYPWSPWIAKGFLNAQPNSPEAAFNSDMSSARISVEWGFNNIVQQFSYLNFTKQMKVFKIPVGQYFINAAFIQNLRTCFVGNQINSYFDLAPLSIDEYLSLPDAFQ